MPSMDFTHRRVGSSTWSNLVGRYFAALPWNVTPGDYAFCSSNQNWPADGSPIANNLNTCWAHSLFHFNSYHRIMFVLKFQGSLACHNKYHTWHCTFPGCILCEHRSHHSTCARCCPSHPVSVFFSALALYGLPYQSKTLAVKLARAVVKTMSKDVQSLEWFRFVSFTLAWYLV